MNIYQQFIHKSRYARWNDNLQRREHWNETVDRYVNFVAEHCAENYKSLDKKDIQEIRQAILNLEVMPSMRALMTAGKALKLDNVASFNCSFLPISNPRCFDELMYILMCGTGVGFSVESRFVNLLPVVAEEFHETETIIKVGDSKIGWASAFRELISLLYVGKIPQIDISKVRPKGARLKTFGGRSSGPEPLLDLFNFSINLFKRAVGRKFTTLECHDLVCKIADIVVVGGVRRSALISLSDLTDDRIRDAKSGNWWESNVQRALANNSAVYEEKPDISKFLDEWHSLYKSHSGERGIFNRKAALLHSDNGRRDIKTIENAGLNPCVIGSTRILTSEGYVPIVDLVGKSVSIWNGNVWSEVTPFSTGINPVMKLKFSDGTQLTTTFYHKFILAGNNRVEAKDLKIGDKLEKFDMPIVTEGDSYSVDAYSQGFYAGDGCENSTRSYLYDTKYMCSPRLNGEIKQDGLSTNRKSWIHGVMYSKTFVPTSANYRYCLDWLAGLFDADGVSIENPNSCSIQVTSINEDFLNEVRLMLTRLGVQAKVTLNRETCFREIKGASYECQATFRLLINSSDVAKLVSLGLKTERLDLAKISPNRDARRFVTVVSIEDLQESVETYCFNEPINHSGTFEGIVTAQCAEIILRPFEFCNLSEVVIKPEDNLESLKKKIRLATIIGTVQSTFTDFRYLRKIWKDNCEEERLLGVSLTGIMDNELTSGKNGISSLEELLSTLRNVAIEVNKDYAEKFGISPSAAITCVKPSGTVSQLVGSSSGIHPSYSPYYIRTVRADIKDPLATFMKDKGIHVEPDVTKPNDNLVFSFPVKSPETSINRTQLSALDQLNLYKVYRDFWCEHNPSITVYVKEDEWIEVAAWVYKNFDSVCGISFLPYSDHVYKQAPYQECTKEYYEEMVAKYPKTIDWDDLSKYELEDATTGTQELSCVAGVCEI